MDPARFDQISKLFATRRLSRRHTLRQLGAAALAGAFLTVRREEAAADCPDISHCIGPRGPDYLHTPPRFFIPGGPYGACWSWSNLGCNPCHTTWDALHALCNQANPQCRGQCEATFPF